MNSLLGDIRYAMRMLIATPGFSVVVVLTLAIGIGVTTAMFSVVNGVLLRPLPFKDPERLILIKERLPKLLPKPISIPAADVLTFRRETTSFGSVAGFVAKQFDLTGHGVPRKIAATRVEWNLFSLLGVQPVLGRAFTAVEDRPESDVVVVSYQFWREQLGGTPAAIGETLILDRKPYQIIGIMPPEFTFPLRVDEVSDIWVPMGFTPGELAIGGTSFAYGALARLKASVSMDQAQADVKRVAKHIEQMFPAAQRGDLQIFGAVVPLVEDVVGDVRKPVLVLFLAVSCVLLIAVVNVANLLLARGSARQRELAIRLALGPAPGVSFPNYLSKACCSARLGAPSDCCSPSRQPRRWWPWFLRISRGCKRPKSMPGYCCSSWRFRLSQVSSLGVPALFALRTDVNESLKEGERGTSAGRHRQRVRASFVVAQVALALILLSSAGLLLRSFQRVLQVDPGFRPQHVLTASVWLSATDYSTEAQLRSFFTHLNTKLEQIPGAKAVGLSTDLPLETRMESALTVDGYRPPPGAGSGLNAFSFVLGNYFQAMGIPLLRGRVFTPMDDENGQKAVIISQALADKFFAGRDPIGGRLKLGTAGGTSPWTTVVGVVGNVKLFGLEDDPLPHTYMPYLQHTPDELKGGTAQTLIMTVRTAGEPASAAASLRSTVWSLDRQVPVTDVRTMQQVIGQSTAPRRFNLVLVGSFAVAALLLAAVGLYGVISYSVSQRTHEIGVRMALGARRGDVLRMVLGSGLTLVSIGVAAGLAGALAASRLLTSYLFAVSPSDPATFVGVALVLAAIALLASMAPALRAARVDPMIALREE